MKDEWNSLDSMGAWTLTDLPNGKNLISCKWVFQIKRDGQGNVERYRAIIVARGFQQVYEIDFNETFVRIESIRHLFALAAFYGLEVIHIDFKNAFINGNSDLELYLSQPRGFEDKSHPNKVLRLNKSLYGLRQAPRIWYLLVSSCLKKLGFRPLK